VTANNSTLDEIPIVNVTPEVFKTVYDYIYQGTIGKVASFPTKEKISLFELADRFQLQRLKVGQSVVGKLFSVAGCMN
jgi:hypothetical protein